MGIEAKLTAELAKRNIPLTAQDGGLLCSAEHVVDGRVRRVYTATPAGVEELDRLRAVIGELSCELLDRD